MASEQKIVPVGEARETPQAITITIVDPSALGNASLDSSLVTSVETQDSSDPNSIVMVTRDGHGSKGILQTVTETHMGTEELPIISSISNPEEEEEETIVHETKLSESFDGGEEETEAETGETFESIGPHCLVCNLDLTSNESDEQVPVFKTQTTATQRRVAVFLSSLIGQKLTSRKAHSDIMCRRCFSLLDRVDSLEVEIRETKEEIVNKYQETVSAYGGRARRRKPATAKKTDYVFPKVEPEDEADQLLDMELDGNFEPQVEDLMEEDTGIQDEEWEPEFKKPRIKRESTDITDTGGPPKRKRGRPRKDASRSKVGPRQRGAAQGLQPPTSTRRVVSVPSAFRKCPHCPTIFLDHLQLAQHLAHDHRDHQQERQCSHCRKHFLTYEDHTACEPCLQWLRQNALPSKMTRDPAALAGSGSSAMVECGHCHQSFKSRVLAELHCLSTGHDMYRITEKASEKVQYHAGNKDVTGLSGKTSAPNPDLSSTPASISSNSNNSSSSSNNNSNSINSNNKNNGSSVNNRKRANAGGGSRGRRGRKRRLMRKNQTACDECGDECGSASSLYTHLRASHPEMFPYPCGVCGRRFSIEASAKEHERRHTVGELQCPVCPLRFSRMSHLHHHSRQHHPDFTSFPCQYCGAVSSTVEALHSHIKVHHGDRLGLPAVFTCEVCQETFHTGKALACHRLSRHPGTAECGICGAQVGRRYLSIHINAVHTREKVHKCEQCGKDFYSRTSLTGHQKRQHGPRKHLCHLCGKGYVHNVELQRHLKAHRNQRDFKCDFCGRSFLKAGDLTYHRRSHTGERPHQCRLCPEAFINPLGLRKHMLKHTTVKKGKRLKYSKKKIDELTSSVLEQDDDELEGVASGANLSHAHPSPGHLPDPQHLAQPLQTFSDTAGVASPQPQPVLQQLAPSDLQVQHLPVTDLDSSQLEGQLELSHVVDDLSSGELLEMGSGLLLEATDVRGGHQGVEETEVVGECKGGNEVTEGEVGQHSHAVQVIYVHFMDPPL